MPTPEELRWLERPMRYMGDSEVRAALAEREAALKSADTLIAKELCRHAVERLRMELNGREARQGQ